jgi:hypothetical protein
MTVPERANYSGHCTIISHGTTQIESGKCVNHASFEEYNITDKNGHRFIYSGLNSDKEQAISLPRGLRRGSTAVRLVDCGRESGRGHGCLSVCLSVCCEYFVL